MTVIYPVIFTATHDDKDTYIAYIPDIDGMTEGYGLSDAYKMARDYIGSTFYNKSDDTIPIPSSISDIDVTKGIYEDGDEAFVSLVDTDLDAYRAKMSKKAVRRNVSIPEWLNQAAEKEHLNVSRILQEALMEKLGVN